MADFCQRCNIDHYFGPHSDFEGRVSPYEFFKEHLVGVALCEGCGPIKVNHLGQCLGGCAAGHVPPEDDEVLRTTETWLRRRRGRLAPVYRLWDWWAGTPWEPGYYHYLRHRWHTRNDTPVDWDYWEGPGVMKHRVWVWFVTNVLRWSQADVIGYLLKKARER